AGVSVDSVVDGSLERQLQVDGILDDVRVDKQPVSVRKCVHVPVLGEDGSLAVRYAVLTQVSWPQIRRNRLERAKARTAGTTPHDPFARRHALPAPQG